MYKLKKTYIERMLGAHLSSREIDFLLYIARFQNDEGIVQSVYFRDVCASINISHQEFYNILRSLSGKQLIKSEKNTRFDYEITLCDNSFSDKNFSEGYLNVESKDFACDEFRRMKAGAKLLYLYMQRYTEGRHMLAANFYAEYSKRLGVTVKTVQCYLKELKDNYFLFVSKKRNRAYHYEMMIKNSTVLDKDPINRPREKQGYLDNICQYLRINYKKYIPDSPESCAVKDTAGLIEAAGSSNMFKKLLQAVEVSFSRQRGEGKRKPILNAALVHKCLTELQKGDYGGAGYVGCPVTS